MIFLTVFFNEKCENDEEKWDEKAITKKDIGISGVFDGTHAFDGAWRAGGRVFNGGCWGNYGKCSDITGGCRSSV